VVEPAAGAGERWLSLTLVMKPRACLRAPGHRAAGLALVVAALSIVALLVLARVALRVLLTGGVTSVIAVGLIFGGPSAT